MSANSNESVNARESRLLKKAARRFLKEERLYLRGLLLVGPVVGLVCALWATNYVFERLGSWPSENGIHDQTKAEQSAEVINSELGRTGGLSIQYSEEQKNEGSDHQAKAESAKTPLDYLSSSRDLAAQEGVWRASWIIALIAAIQTLIGFWGLIFIAKTWKATRGALFQAEKTTEAAMQTLDNERETRSLELQPYIKLVDVVFPRADPNWGGGTTQLSIRICNSGSTAARKFRNAIVHRDERTDRFGGFGETRGGKHYFFNLKTAYGGEENISPDLVLADFLTPSDEITMHIPVDYSCEDANKYISHGYLDVGPPARHELTQCDIIFSVDFNNTFPEGLVRRVFFYISYFRGYGNDEPKIVYRIINDQILEAQS